MEDLSRYNPEGSAIRNIQMRLVDMLDVFVEICDRHNINYWIACGTLLGARRHGGFIPWDDDMDIVVLHSDYNKLISVLKEELPENLKLQARGTDKNYWMYYARLRDTRSRIYGKKVDFYDYKGIFIDIFFIEPVFSMPLKKIIDKFLYSEVQVGRSKTLYNKIKYGIMSRALPVIRSIIKMIRWYNKNVNKTKKYTYSFGTFTYPTYNIEDFFPVSEIMFEGKKYKAPHDVDSYLTDNFDGNFMVIPKPEDRLVHVRKVEFFNSPRETESEVHNHLEKNLN